MTNQMRSWIGTPFDFGARVKKVGIDCWNLTCVYLESVGTVLPNQLGHVNLTAYTNIDNFDDIYQVLSRYCDVVDEPQEGDIILMRSSIFKNHLGIVFDKEFMHVYQGSGNKVCMTPLSEEWRRRIVYTFRPKTWVH